MHPKDLFTAFTETVNSLSHIAQSIKNAGYKEKERYLFLLIISIVAGLLLYTILSIHVPLENPLWYSSYMLLSLIAGFLAGKWLGIHIRSVFIGFVLWLFGLFAMKWYAIDIAGGTLLPWNPRGPFLPWVYTLILLLPICGLLSWLGAWLATRKTSKRRRFGSQRR